MIIMAEKKGLLGGNLLPKLLILFAVGLIVSVFVFGLPVDIPSIIFTVIRILVGIGIIVLALKIIEKIVIPKSDFSPSESWKHKLIRIAEMSKPPRTSELWMRGEDMHTHYFFGKIVGLLFIPDWAGSPTVDKKTGAFEYEEKKDREGNKSYDVNGKQIMVHKLENITEKNGDWLFVIQRGIIPAFSTKVLVRASVKLCSDIGEKVWIKTVNLVPTGDFFYPSQQWQADIVKINMQTQAEVVQESLLHWLDLVSNVTEVSLKSDPNFVKMMQSNTENISQKESMPIQSLGNRG